MRKANPSIYPIRVILRDKQGRGVRRRARQSIGCEGQFYASALDTAAFFADLGSGGEMNVQRQENNEQQWCNTDDASKFLGFGGQRRQHIKNLAQSIYLCQRGPKLSGIIGHLPDAANSAGLSQGISSLVILLQVADAASESNS